jgi:hypothetical protein
LTGPIALMTAEPASRPPGRVQESAENIAPFELVVEPPTAQGVTPPVASSAPHAPAPAAGLNSPAPSSGPEMPMASPGPIEIAPGAQESLDPRTALLVGGVVRLPHGLEQLARFDPTAAAVLELASPMTAERVASVTIPVVAEVPATGNPGPSVVSAPDTKAHVDVPLPAPPGDETRARVDSPRASTGSFPVAEPMSAVRAEHAGVAGRAPDAVEPTPGPPAPVAAASSSSSSSSVPMTAASSASGATTPRPVTSGESPAVRPFQTLLGARVGVPRGHADVEGGKAAMSARADPSVEAQIARGLSAMLRQRGGSVTLRLSPESLGLVRVEVRVNEGRVFVRIEAQTDPARRLLADHLSSLRLALEDQGLRIDRVEVSRPRDAAEDGATEGRDHRGQQGRGGGDTPGRDPDPGRRGGAQAGSEPAPQGRWDAGGEPSGGARVGGGAEGRVMTDAGLARERARLGVDVTA